MGKEMKDAEKKEPEKREPEKREPEKRELEKRELEKKEPEKKESEKKEPDKNPGKKSEKYPEKNSEKKCVSRSNSLSTRLRRVLVGISFTLLLTTVISLFIIVRKERMDYSIRESEGILNGLTNSIQSEIERYKELSRLIMVDEKLVAYLRAKPDKINAGMVNEARYGIMSILNVTENVDTVFVFREDGQYLSTALPSNKSAYIVDLDKMSEASWRNVIINKKGNAVISINGNQALFRANGNPMITISRAVYDLLSQKRTGVMLMNISDSLLERILGDETRKRMICIMGTDGTFLAGNEDLMAYYDTAYENTETVHKTIRKGSRRLMISGRKVEGMPIVVLCESDMGGRVVPMETVYVFVILLVIFIISIFMAGVFITRHITEPVFRLAEAMETNRQEGKLEKIDAGMPPNELGMLEEGYNNMIEHVNELFTSLIEKEKTLQKAEMRVLHEQIKPHFLYNSLETISFMAVDAGAEDVYSALETLGSFYRNFLSKGDREIPLQKEICIVQDYLALQKLRYGDIIQDEYDIAEDTKDCIIPKLILQPLAENCIYHGIRPKGEEGIIRIKSWLEERTLHIMVRDTGVGMEQEMIDQMLSEQKKGDFEKTDDPNESFGLWGTIERIRCFCDDNDVVRIRSEEGEFTEVEFILPCRWEKQFTEPEEAAKGEGQ